MVVYLLSKRAPSKSIKTAPGPRARLGSQEPRRPRFSFFHLHNVKELTIPPSPASIVIGSNASRILQEKTLLLVAQQISLPLRKIVNSGSETRSASSTWPGYTQHLIQCQHPIFVSSAARNSFQSTLIRKPETQNSFFASVACRSVRSRSAPRSAAVIGVLRANLIGVNTLQ